MRERGLDTFIVPTHPQADDNERSKEEGVGKYVGFRDQDQTHNNHNTESLNGGHPVYPLLDKLK